MNGGGRPEKYGEILLNRGILTKMEKMAETLDLVCILNVDLVRQNFDWEQLDTLPVAGEHKARGGINRPSYILKAIIVYSVRRIINSGRLNLLKLNRLRDFKV